MTQTPTVLQMLPISGSTDEALKHHWDYIYEPDSKEVLDGLLMRFVESQVYQGAQLITQTTLLVHLKPNITKRVRRQLLRKFLR